MPPIKNLSFADLMGGVGKGQRAMGAIPGAQRVPLGMRQEQRGMLPAEVVEQYNKAGMFGKTATGEPIRATMSSTYEDAVKAGFMPPSGKLRLDPESKAPKTIDEAQAYGFGPKMTWSPGLARPGKELLASELDQLMKQAAMRDPRRSAANPEPVMTDIYAMDVKPDGYGLRSPDAAWWKDLPAKGKEMYSLMYDLIRAQGQGNTAGALTDVNVARRLGNVASHSLGHGNLGYISPVAEKGYAPGTSTQLFHNMVTSPHSEDYYLKKLFGGPGLVANQKTDELMNAALDVRTPDFAQMTPDETLGLLFTREAQLAGAYGPGTGTGSPLRISQVRPYENAQLRSMAEPHILPEIRANTGNIQGAMGPATLGRQATTEALIRGMLKGYDPEEIVERLIKEAPPDAYKNRYKKGGLAHAAVIA
jgi:hypothetical protein